MLLIETQKLCEKTLLKYSWMLEHVFNQGKILEFCEKAVQKEARARKYVPDHYKTYVMYEKTVKRKLQLFVTICP